MVELYKTVHLSKNPCYTLVRSGLIESPYIPASRTRFVQPGKIEIDANERAVIGNRNAAFSFAPSSILSLTIYGDRTMNKFKTENYYREINKDSLCSCDYCRNYYKEVKAAYPELSDHLAGMGVDIEKPFETMPLEPYEGNIEYIAVQYIVIGNAANLKSEDVYGVHIGIADSHPMADIDEEYYIIEISPIRLKWAV